MDNRNVRPGWQWLCAAVVIFVGLLLLRADSHSDWMRALLFAVGLLVVVLCFYWVEQQAISAAGICFCRSGRLWSDSQHSDHSPLKGIKFTVTAGSPLTTKRVHSFDKSLRHPGCDPVLPDCKTRLPARIGFFTSVCVLTLPGLMGLART